MSLLENFKNWKEFLSNKVEQAERAGMSDEAIENVAFEVGDYLNKHVSTENKEQQILKDLWDVADEEERKVIASIMIKYVKK